MDTSNRKGYIRKGKFGQCLRQSPDNTSLQLKTRWLQALLSIMAWLARQDRYCVPAEQFGAPPEITVVRQLLLHGSGTSCWDAAITQQTCQVVDSTPHPDMTAMPLEKTIMAQHKCRRHSVSIHCAIVKVPIDYETTPYDNKKCNT